MSNFGQVAQGFGRAAVKFGDLTAQAPTGGGGIKPMAGVNSTGGEDELEKYLNTYLAKRFGGVEAAKPQGLKIGGMSSSEPKKQFGISYDL